MSLPARLVTSVAVLGALLAVGGGAAAGMALGERASRPGHDELVIVEPALAGSTGDQALRSRGGFTGFDGPGSLDGAVLRSGTVGPTRDGAFEVTSEGATLSLRSTSPARLFQITRASSELRPGDVVVVRVEPDGSASGVLRVPGDLGAAAATPGG